MPTAADRREYSDISKQIEREDTLIDKRTMWLLIFEGFIFGAVASGLSKTGDVLISKYFCTRSWSAISGLAGC